MCLAAGRSLWGRSGQCSCGSYGRSSTLTALMFGRNLYYVGRYWSLSCLIFFAILIFDMIFFWPALEFGVLVLHVSPTAVWSCSLYAFLACWKSVSIAFHFSILSMPFSLLFRWFGLLTPVLHTFHLLFFSAATYTPSLSIFCTHVPSVPLHNPLQSLLSFLPSSVPIHNLILNSLTIFGVGYYWSINIADLA